MGYDEKQPFELWLRRVATGEVVKVPADRSYGAWQEHAYWWCEGGQFDCDCNRSIAFEEGGGDLGDDDGSCNSMAAPHRFVIDRVVLANGTTIWPEGKPAEEGGC